MKHSLRYISPAILFFLVLILGGWGATGHKVISTDATLLFKGKAEALSYISKQIINYASAADSRKSSDPTEAPKHYIDIDSYPEFVSTGRISMDYDSLVAKYGESHVIDIGTLPWAIINTFDTLKACFKRNDWNKAGLVAADLGHYVGDSHMPLHLTKNYNGYETNQGGVHSRYETDLINAYSSQIKFDMDSLQIITDVPQYVFSYIYYNYQYKDSVLNADKEASSFAGTNKGSVYLQKFWELTGTFTDSLFKNAACRLADLVYTAWVESGSPQPGVAGINVASNLPDKFMLKQNYPNPFNPSTTIEYDLPSNSNVKLTIYDALGKEILVAVNGYKPAGKYHYKFNANNLPSGIYIYKLSAHNNMGKEFHQAQKMLLVK